MKSEDLSKRKSTYEYTPQNAAIYSQLGVIGTTYEVSFNEMARILGDLHGKTVLDYGTGAGRSAKLLKTLGAGHVIGVDHSHNMIEEALKKQEEGIAFELIQSGKIPLPDSSVDAVVTAHVWVEMKSLDEMKQSAKELYRVLKKGGIIVVITTSPYSVGHEYVSYTYKKALNLKSGDPVTCVVKGEKTFEIDDTYWTEEDSLKVLKNAGFEDLKVTYPLSHGEGWLEETKVAPDMVIAGRK